MNDRLDTLLEELDRKLDETLRVCFQLADCHNPSKSLILHSRIHRLERSVAAIAIRVDALRKERKPPTIAWWSRGEA